MKLLLPVLFVATTAFAQFPSLSPLSSIEQQIGSTQLKIRYERPAARGRTVFGSLVPYNQLWRTGAGNCTKVCFSEKVLIGKTSVDAGTYSLLTIPDGKTWTVILNSDTTLFGTDKYSQAKDVVRLTVQAGKTSRMYESFTIDIDVVPNNAVIYLSWATTQVSFAVQTMIDKTLMDFIRSELLTGRSKDPEVYATGAEYLYYLGRDRDIALKLVDQAIAIRKELWYDRLKNDILENRLRKISKE